MMIINRQRTDQKKSNNRLFLEQNVKKRAQEKRKKWKNIQMFIQYSVKFGQMNGSKNIRKNKNIQSCEVRGVTSRKSKETIPITQIRSKINKS